jgi:hypothetical protein
MDANKAIVLREIEYTIHGTCATCVNGQFRPGSMWGTCAGWKYDHLKHADSTRQLSINMLGRCLMGYKPDPKKIADLGKFQEFLVS